MTEVYHNAVSALNQIPLGWAIIMIIAVAGAGIALYKYAKIIFHKIKAHVLKENEVQETREDIIQTLNTIKQAFDDFKQEFEEFKDESSKRAEASSRRFDTLDKDFEDLKKHSEDNDQMLFSKIEKFDKCISDMGDKVELLIGSDKESIEVYISNEYYKWIQRQEIEIHALEMIEKRYAQYQKEHGSSFIDAFVTELQRLPKV